MASAKSLTLTACGAFCCNLGWVERSWHLRLQVRGQDAMVVKKDALRFYPRWGTYIGLGMVKRPLATVKVHIQMAQ